MFDSPNTLNLSAPVFQEYRRWEDKVSSICDSENRRTVSTLDVLQAHFLIVDFFAADHSHEEGLGGIGPKSVQLLESAVSRQDTSLGGTYKWENPYDICATLFFGLIQNHPFHDANKRTAFLSLIYLLQKYGIWPNEDKQRFEELAVRVAEGNLDSYARYKSFSRESRLDVEIRFISDFIRRYSKKIDRTNHTITFRDLKRILTRYSFEMENPSGNMIDIVKEQTIEKGVILGFQFRDEKVVKERIYRTGFPGWTRQVSKGDIKGIRKATGLDEKNGYDSQGFFDNANNLNRLIAYYQEPLRRLADK